MVKNLLLLAVCLGVALAAPAQNTIIDSFKVDGMYRSFRLYLPPGAASAPRPLVLNMHGMGSNAFEQQYYSYMMPIADTANFYIAFPQGTSHNGTTFWNVGFSGLPPVDDVKFLNALIDTLSNRYALDEARVYATGMSNGGYMAHWLGIQLGDRIAAVASVTGSIVPQQLVTAAPARPMPVLQVHGTADAIVPYTGFAQGAPIDSVMAFWVRHNGCNPKPLQSAVPNANTSDGSTADHFVWRGGRDGTSVELYRVNGGGHTWPGSPINIGGATNGDFSASAEIWRFFSQYRQSTSVGQLHEPGGKRLQIVPNPAGSRLRIVADGAGTTVVSDASGRVVLRSADKELDISTLPSGVYMLRRDGAAGTAVSKFVKE